MRAAVSSLRGPHVCWIVGLLLAAGCDTTIPRIVEADAGHISVSCMEAPNHDDLAWLQDQILSPSCSGFSTCHKGTARQAAHLNLEEGMSDKNLVNVHSRLMPWRILVVPGDPENSYLMTELGWDGAVGRLCLSGTMPYNNPQLCEAKKEAFVRWIEGLDDVPDAGPTDAAAASDGPLVPGLADAAVAADGAVAPGLADAAVAADGAVAPGLADAAIAADGPLVSGPIDAGPPPADAGPSGPDAGDTCKPPNGAIARTAEAGPSGGCAIAAHDREPRVWPIVLLCAGLLGARRRARRRLRPQGLAS